MNKVLIKYFIFALITWLSPALAASEHSNTKCTSDSNKYFIASIKSLFFEEAKDCERVDYSITEAGTNINVPSSKGVPTTLFGGYPSQGIVHTNPSFSDQNPK